ncbi:hypothetical protein DOTSEDRAFT_33364 [Dothistroma septosporum NZE10]|uniref:Uncharacterized protein n=1 Tax=Dothistroma septosporum (strain NZE10 / CBS 128990) TaxID=675120 RepID=N1PTN5_DOTSN|nr:hypothetical protein DOTSEDRAFT_33364 [Dothistroma septosporum NZE10]
MIAQGISRIEPVRRYKTARSGQLLCLLFKTACRGNTQEASVSEALPICITYRLTIMSDSCSNPSKSPAGNSNDSTAGGSPENSLSGASLERRSSSGASDQDYATRPSAPTMESTTSDGTTESCIDSSDGHSSAPLRSGSATFSPARHAQDLPERRHMVPRPGARLDDPAIEKMWCRPM